MESIINNRKAIIKDYDFKAAVEAIFIGAFLRLSSDCINQDRVMTTIFVCLLLPFGLYGQGINYPGNSPVNNGGVGIARTDPDNLFTRNNAAGMTDIEDEEGRENRGKWRVLSEFHFTYYRYRRQFTPIGFDQTVTSKDSIAWPTASGEITYTAKSRRFAFGVGLSQTFGFESKLKDDEKVVGSQALFFDTKVASNDVAIAAAVRLHPKFSVGGSLIFGRAFLVQTAPIEQLAQLGIIKLSRLDVKETGGYGASLNFHYRPTEKINVGFNFKTARKYNLQGSLDTVQPIINPIGLQLVPLRLDVRVLFNLPFIAETGIKIQPNEKVFFDFDYRFYNYAKAFDQLSVLDKANNSTIATQNIRAKNVHLINFGGAYKLNQISKLLFGSGFTTDALSDTSFTPALNNAGGVSFSGGVARRISGIWMNVGVTAIFSINRNIPVNGQNAFPGDYKANGFTIGIGFRK
jgi:long-subunit fatty acid transport protein